MTSLRISALIGALLLLTALSGCDRRETLLAVNAHAKTRTTPDLAIVTLGVVARGPTAREAQAAQNVRMAAVQTAVRAAGAQDSDVQTVGFSLEPQFSYVRGQPTRISGYISRNMIAIRIKNLNAVSDLVDATVAQGANELQGIQFAFQDEESSRDAARAQAVETARRRAERYAKAANMRVARIRSIIEPGADIATPGIPRDGYGRPVATEQAASPVNPGQLDNDARVTVVFELR